MTIPVMRPWLGQEEAEAAAEAITSGWIAQGPRVARFETAFAEAIGADHAVALSSCTVALHLALIVAGVGPGDEVVVPSLSFIATANAVRYVGAQPVFADVDEATLNLVPRTVEPHLTERTRAVILVDQGGIPADLDAMRALCEPRGIVVVEDAACATGSVYRNRPVGSAAWLAAFSFHPRKLLTTGEGGMLVTSDAHIAERARRLREHGMSVSAAQRHASRQPVIEEYLETGYNYRMTDIQAAVGLVQLGKLDAMVTRRRSLAARYQDLLADIPGLRTARDPEYGTTNYQSFWVMLPDDCPVSRNDLLRVLADAGVSARRGIMAAHVEPAYADLRATRLPVTEKVTAGSLILPLFHDLTREEQDLVVSVLHDALGQGSQGGPARQAPAAYPESAATAAAPARPAGKAKVLVTGVGGRSVGAGILHALKRVDPAVRDRWEIVATDADPFSWGLYIADHKALVPLASEPGYLDRIQELIKTHDVVAVIPGTEPEAAMLAAHRDKLPVPVIANEAGLMPLMMDKKQAEARLRELGLNFIPSYSWDRREDAVAEFGFPVVIKPTRNTGGSRGVYLAMNRQELDALAPFVRVASGPVVQPYIGDADEEYTVGVLSDKSGNVIDSIVIRRKLIGLSLLDAKTSGDVTAVISTGISQGYVIRHHPIQQFCEQLAKRLDSRGPLNIQLRVHNGEFYVFEIHPRFSGTTAIRASAGFNEPDVLLRNHLYDEEFGPLPYRDGLGAIRAFEHVLVPIDDMCSDAD
jgi:dTDP-4-amino-4,6-dideoxygalactose transaminase/carbamoylphosphate synthase large subunit